MYMLDNVLKEYLCRQSRFGYVQSYLHYCGLVATNMCVSLTCNNHILYHRFCELINNEFCNK